MPSSPSPVKWHEVSPKRRKDLEAVGWSQESWDGEAAAKKRPAKQQQRPTEHTFEFGGPVNVIFMILGLPIGVWGLFLACNSNNCSVTKVPDISQYTFYSHEAMAVVLLWTAWLVVLWLIVPGPWVNGCKLSDGSHLKYKLNGFRAMLITYAVVGAAQYNHVIDLAWLHDNQLQLPTASIIVSVVLSIYLYIASGAPGTMKAQPGNTGIMHYDFFLGAELNPRIGDFDLKSFFELRPGLIGWTLLNASMAVKQYQLKGELSSAMVFVNLLQLVYVVDALWNEAAILTTMDITTDGFGFMLAFGDIAWVPFTYGLQARYLAFTDVTLSPAHSALIAGTGLLGYYVFRGANGQKNTFRNNPDDPSVRNLKTMPTERGTKLIIDGWWGKSRHINYFGDWIMAWAWCLPCGFEAAVPYFYVVYFAGLLVHREMRDDHCCREKYGKDWDKYCSIVKYHIVPYVY